MHFLKPIVLKSVIMIKIADTVATILVKCGDVNYVITIKTGGDRNRRRDRPLGNLTSYSLLSRLPSDLNHLLILRDTYIKISNSHYIANSLSKLSTLTETLREQKNKVLDK